MGTSDFARVEELAEDSRQRREPFGRAESKVLIKTLFLVSWTNNLLTAHLLMKIFRIL